MVNLDEEGSNKADDDIMLKLQKAESEAEMLRDMLYRRERSEHTGYREDSAARYSGSHSRDASSYYANNSRAPEDRYSGGGSREYDDRNSRGEKRYAEADDRGNNRDNNQRSNDRYSYSTREDSQSRVYDDRGPGQSEDHYNTQAYDRNGSSRGGDQRYSTGGGSLSQSRDSPRKSRDHDERSSRGEDRYVKTEADTRDRDRSRDRDTMGKGNRNGGNGGKKKLPCSFFGTKVGCHSGDRCRFMHSGSNSNEDSRPSSSKRKSSQIESSNSNHHMDVGNNKKSSSPVSVSNDKNKEDTSRMLKELQNSTGRPQSNLPAWMTAGASANSTSNTSNNSNTVTEINNSGPKVGARLQSNISARMTAGASPTSNTSNNSNIENNNSYPKVGANSNKVKEDTSRRLKELQSSTGRLSNLPAWMTTEKIMDSQPQPQSDVSSSSPSRNRSHSHSQRVSPSPKERVIPQQSKSSTVNPYPHGKHESEKVVLSKRAKMSVIAKTKREKREKNAKRLITIAGLCICKAPGDNPKCTLSHPRVSTTSVDKSALTAANIHALQLSNGSSVSNNENENDFKEIVRNGKGNSKPETGVLLFGNNSEDDDDESEDDDDESEDNFNSLLDTIHSKSNDSAQLQLYMEKEADTEAYGERVAEAKRKEADEFMKNIIGRQEESITGNFRGHHLRPTPAWTSEYVKESDVFQDVFERRSK